MKKSIILLLVLIHSVSIYAQNSEVIINSGWIAKRASEIPADGTVITTPEFQMTGWMEAVVPGTALTTLLHNDVFPDPFYGLNNELIPDIYNTGAAFYTFWFRNTFTLTALKPGQQVWLNFRGINYSAEVFLNGKRISYDTHRGMFLRQKYLITPHLHAEGTNILAVIVHPPDPVGEANGGQGGDGVIARSVTQQYTPGWDWVCPVRDRNTGIWDQVSIEITGPVDLRHPYVKTRVPGVRTPGPDQQPAFLDISAELFNASGAVQKGNLVAGIESIKQAVPFTVEPGKSIIVSFPEIEIKNPKLWWPNGMGGPALYRLQLKLEQDGSVTDSENIIFGIRETGNWFDDASGGRVFTINGQKIFIKGGNWISSDLLLRHSPERYEAEVKMHTQMNMNMIRIWGGSITERPEFYEACDRYGMLVWQDLWVTGDCNGRWFDPRKKESQARRQAYPDDQTLFFNSVIDQVKMLRNHPSLYMWCGGNEFPPPPHIHKVLEKEIFPEHDGTRYYLNESTSPELARNTIGGGGDGPYGIQNPATFFTTPSYPFNPEIGSVGMPNVEAMRKMMSEKDLTPPVNDRPNRVWQYHKYIGYGETIDNFGEIKGIEDFCKKAQVVNYEQYRALQEGFNAGMWDTCTGMLVWKNQNPWTSLRGQFYDVYLDQTGGFYGYMHAARPLHIQLNLNDSAICIINQTVFDADNLTAQAEFYDLKGNRLSSQQFSVNVSANSKTIAGKANTSKKPAGLYFLRLILQNDKGETVDENLYWLTTQPSGYQDLEKLMPAELKIGSAKVAGGKTSVTVRNTGKETAFFTRLKIINNKSKELVLPVFMSDNYFTLFPGEQKQVEVDLNLLPSGVQPGNLMLQAEPWNSAVTEIKIQ
jgi:mannosylglycoprotein endo-beta-mannosidase